MAHPSVREDQLKPGLKRRLKELRKLARRDKTFMALVDMYRYLDQGCPEVLAYWYAHRDWEAHGGPSGRFDVLGPGYSSRELGFLDGRGLGRPSSRRR